MSTPDAPLQRMPVLDHFRDLRGRLRNIVIGIAVATVVCYPFKERLYAYLSKPLLDALRLARAQGISGRMTYLNPVTTFLIPLKTALVAALFLASPFVFYQIWRFISPGLYRKERRWTLTFAVLSGVLFVLGGWFCYRFVLPAGYEFFLQMGKATDDQLQKLFGVNAEGALLQPMISMDEHFELSLLLLLAFGAVFELPLLLCFLALGGIVSAKSLWRFNRYAILIFAILGAVLTPGDLVVGQLLMAGSLTVLYNLSIALVLLVQRTRKKQTPDEEHAAQ